MLESCHTVMTVGRIPLMVPYRYKRFLVIHKSFCKACLISGLKKEFVPVPLALAVFDD